MLILEATYSKKLGLPNFSSHSFMVSVRAEVSSLRRLDTETARLYRILQESVDRQVEQVGFLPDATRYGMIADAPRSTNGAAAPVNGSRNGHSPAAAATEGAQPVDAVSDAWGCSEKQRALIERVAKEQKFSAADLNRIAQRLFNLPVQRLNKKQASDFIGELLAVAGPPPRFRRPTKATTAPVSANGTR